MQSQLQKLVSKHLWHPLILNLTGERDRLRFAAEYESTQYSTPAEIALLQETRLREQLIWVMKHSPFYRQRFRDVGVDRVDEDVWGLLAKVPVLTKREIQSAGEVMLPDSLGKRNWICDQTGGSTGEPIRFWMDRVRYESRVGAMIRHDRWAGYDLGCSVAYLWGAPQDTPHSSWKTNLRGLLLGKQLWLDAGNLTEARLVEFNVSLKRVRPDVLIGYANALVAMARFLKHNNIAAYQPKAIISSAEALTAEGRCAIEESFGAPVFNRYGSREFSVVASECEQHNGLHVMAEGLVVEVEKGSEHDPSSDRGAILVTDLLNKAMPLIRYRIGDVGMLRPGVCACGRGLPLLDAVEGRVTDFLVGTQGQLVSGVFLATYVVANRPALGQVQLLQHEAGQVVVRIKPATSYDAACEEPYLRGSLKKFLGHDACVDIELVEHISLTASGKQRFSISYALPGFADVNPELAAASTSFPVDS